MALTGQDYAERAQTDMATAIGMRLAMMEAVSQWKAAEASGQFDGMSAAEKTTAARTMIREQTLSNDILQNAGTGEIVARYYEDIIDTQPSPDNVVAFLNDIDRDDIDGISEALANNDNKKLLSAAGGFSSSFREHLGRESVTGSFQEYLTGNAAQLADVEMRLGTFSQEQQSLIDNYEDKFRTADEWDDWLYNRVKEKMGERVLGMFQSIGFAFPMVTDRIAEFQPEVEQELGPIIEAANAAKDSPSAETLQLLQKELGLEAEIQATEQDIAKLADEVLDGVQKVRSGEIGERHQNYLAHRLSGAVEKTEAPALSDDEIDQAMDELENTARMMIVEDRDGQVITELLNNDIEALEEVRAALKESGTLMLGDKTVSTADGVLDRSEMSAILADVREKHDIDVAEARAQEIIAQNLPESFTGKTANHER